MVYAGTIILNLLAASVDNSFSSMKNMSASNATVVDVTNNENIVSFWIKKDGTLK
jgi:hypothetical protein